MPKTNIVKLLKECVVLSRKTWWLTLINWRLERYIKVSIRNKRLYYKIDSMIYRYNRLFGEDLCAPPVQKRGVNDEKSL